MLDQGAKEWEDRVVGFFLDKKLPYMMTKDVLKRRLKLKGDMEVLERDMDLVLEGDMYYFKFNNCEDKTNVLEEGPILSHGSYLL
ncbi:hypothetical protein FRX31_013411 [Thalictrum thalictroides]|uniref:DUF4283 domain-containing protein n=1 Tax=Thalictrum thalictroides TaxID=46969 RepID=A0A7J6WHU1_THATH|nr:hypothetical protein FRX31_013411 [Thalictrum thalictroides]